ncbi:chaperone modulator CbpM [Yeosuana sp. AK3]|nr:MerR family transcriptional regulator [Flavobacteriia bacterium]NCP05517.1 MerR family transcriptional regulator [Flavobacteriales bacterium]PIV92391.1 MAG: MerR family transcriptional regulator [Flavobacteriaceae bacterium CG17_big_fil_post_rev_8_21_14_2_50_33_15]PIY11789.1 MAG: MerR family transcriptional regulator [Flavobacteriaceae bacterium CG_4_10_14_3_um_filter_33_47]PJB16766.1 MAG: MerR family transcriptional regulator [Flavobacteriaceae bacterium CG_4_9_14_3_um_filter_33_16]
MDAKNLIQIQTLCSHYNLEFSFFDDLNNTGLIEIEIVEEKQFIHQDQIGNLEKMIRLHNELHLNLEGIDVVFNLLEKERQLHKELNALKNRLRLYENI